MHDAKVAPATKLVMCRYSWRHINVGLLIRIVLWVMNLDEMARGGFTFPTDTLPSPRFADVGYTFVKVF